MDITFLVPCKDLAGGLRVAAAYGNALLRRGHHVTVIYPRRRLPLRETARRQVKRWIHREQDHLDRFQGKLLKVRAIREKYMPSADCLIATAWETAEWARDFSDRCGKKFYLVQHYETWSGDQARVDATFQYPFQKIVISNWLKQVMVEKTGQTDIPVIPNGRDFFLSEALGDGIHRPFDIGMLYSPVAFKRTGDGIEAIRRVRETFPRIRTVFFGSEWPKEELFKNAKFYRRPAQDHIRKIYLSTRIWISASLTEGFCLPALEAISLGCAVVATDSLGIRDIIQSGENGLLVEPGKPERLAQKIVRVLGDPALERKLRIAGLQRSEAFSWEKSADQLEAVLGIGD